MFSCLAARAFLLLSLAPLGALAQDKPCTIHDNGKFYDLNPLKLSKDYEVKTSTGLSLKINVCQNVRTDLFGINDDSIDAGDVAGFIRRGHGDFILGKVNTSLSVLDSRPRFVMSDGSRCKPKPGAETTDIRASTMVEFICDTSFGSSSPRLLAQLPPGDDEIGCAYFIEWRTPYACPTSEGSGVWGFLAILAVIFLVLLLTYTILGTLYNRFVLQLRGFDQIPQFSIESMKYHGAEAWDWIKDMSAALNTGRPSGTSHGYSSMPSGGLPTTNPVSHHTQAAGYEHSEGTEGAGLDSGGFGGANFIRPQPGRNRSSAFQRTEINPISHQSQVNAAQSLSFTTSPPSSAPIQSMPRANPGNPQNLTLPSGARGSIAQERDFMLGEDDEDMQELGDVNVAVNAPATGPTSSREASNAQVDGASTLNITQSNSVAAARGRDLGNGDVTLL